MYNFPSNNTMSFERFHKARAHAPLVKVCGLQTVEAAQRALEAGADCLGIICVPNRKRTVQPETAAAISELVHSSPEYSGRCLVGVFRNQPKEDVRRLAEFYGVDVVQLHGDEDWREYQQFLDRPVIKRVVFPRDRELVTEMCSDAEASRLCMPLFDSEAGGTGEVLDWGSIAQWASEQGDVKYILAGGLTPANVSEAVALPGVVGVDVSGGVETDGVKDLAKVDAFVQNARGQ